MSQPSLLTRLTSLLVFLARDILTQSFDWEILDDGAVP